MNERESRPRVSDIVDSRIFADRYAADEQYMCWGCRNPSYARTWTLEDHGVGDVTAMCPRCGSYFRDDAHEGLRAAMSTAIADMRTSLCEECMEPRGATWIEVTTIVTDDPDHPELTFGFCGERHAIVWLMRRSGHRLHCWQLDAEHALGAQCCYCGQVRGASE